MSSSSFTPSVNTLMKNLALQNFQSASKFPHQIIMDRTHYSGGGGGGGSYHSHGGGGGSSKKNNIALTALTLLSFLFFLNILQNCLQEHMDSMNQQAQVIIMQARQQEIRDASAQKRKGEIQLTRNTSGANKNTRHNAVISRVKPDDEDDVYVNEMPQQIAVKLKTYDKGRN